MPFPSRTPWISRRVAIGPEPLGVLPLLVLVVLLLFAVMALTPHGIYHEFLPTARSATVVSGTFTTVGIDRNGQFWILDHPDPGPIAHADLADRLRATFDARGRRPRLALKADPGITFASILDLLEVTHRLDLAEINLLVSCPGNAEAITAACPE
jgi:biopolymer transport protein ExbD